MIILGLIFILSLFPVFYQYTGIEGLLNASLKTKIIGAAVGIVGLLVGYYVLKKS